MTQQVFDLHEPQKRRKGLPPNMILTTLGQVVDPVLKSKRSNFKFLEEGNEE